MKRAFIPPLLRPDVTGSYYDVAAKKPFVLRDEVSISQILDLKSRSEIIKRLFVDNLELCGTETDLIEELRSCLVRPQTKG